MTRACPLVPRTVLALFTVCLLPAALSAQVVVIDYDASTTPDFEMSNYEEDGIITTVQTGHYEIIADALGGAGDHVFNIDDQEHGYSSVLITMQGGYPFDAERLDVVNPAETAGEFVISAVGGTGGSVDAPTVGGNFELGFSGISALQITQTDAGAFAFDELELNLLPEPATAPAFLVLTGVLALLGRRRSC